MKSKQLSYSSRPVAFFKELPGLYLSSKESDVSQK